MSYQPPPPPLPPPPPNVPGMPSRPPGPGGPERPGVGIGVGWGVVGEIGAVILSLFLAQLTQNLAPEGVSSGWSQTIFVAPHVILALAAVGLMFIPRLRMVGTGILIAVAGVWVVFLGPLIGLSYLIDSICSGFG